MADPEPPPAERDRAADPARRAWDRGLRRDERALVARAGAVLALVSAGGAMSSAAADALFLAELGPGHLGAAMAASSALLAVVLAVVGAVADRRERRRVLAGLAIGSALALAALAALVAVAPAPAAVATLVLGKQLAAATDLALWVALAEQLDARRSRRILPLIGAAGGAGAAAGAALVVPLATAGGPIAVLAAGAGVLALAAASALRLPATRRVAAAVAPPLPTLIARAWRDGARAVRAHALARSLAAVVALAGAAAALVYFALGAAVAARGGSASELAAMLGAVRGGGQLVTLGVQLAIAPRLIAWLGTGSALLVAPAVAVAAGLGLVAAPVIAVAVAAQIAARAVDAGVQTPAEKLAQTLLPAAVRGRVGGFLDGTAKRAGAVVGGLLAAALAGAPTGLAIALVLVAGAWLAAAAALARRLPALAIERVATSARGADGQGEAELGELDAALTPRAIAALEHELAGPRAGRAAEVLARLHERARIDAVAPLVRAVVARGEAPLWEALGAVIDERAAPHGPALVAAAAAARGEARVAAVRALGRLGGLPPATLRAAGAGGDPALALAAAVAARRAEAGAAGAIAELAAASREGAPAAGAAVTELAAVLAAELARARRAEAGAAVPSASGGALADGAPALAAARALARALRRGRGDAAGRVAALGALGQLAVAGRARRGAELALLRADLLELVRERLEQPPAGAAAALVARAQPGRAGAAAEAAAVDPAAGAHARAPDEAPELAAALRLYGALLAGEEAAPAADLRRIARALGEPDDAVRAAAEAALGALGQVAAAELVATAAWGRRRARDRAAALLAALPVTPADLERLIEAELAALAQTSAALAGLGAEPAVPAAEPSAALLARRLAERLTEIAHTVLLLVAARRRSPAIAAAAAAWRRAHTAGERARALAVIEAALPRSLVARLVDTIDELTPAERTRALARRGQSPPTRPEVIRAELAGGDRLARALALHALPAAERGAHRATLARAALAEVEHAAPLDLLRRVAESLAEPIPEDGAEMPSRVETLIALGRAPLLAALTTRQLADVAERARALAVPAGALVIPAGDLLDALLVVDDGELRLGDRAIARGEAVDELACVAPIACPHDLRAATAARIIRLERRDFEELVDDVPGLAAAVCRALGERARRAADAGYRSPLASRA
jgi:hypothetical protein